MCVIGAECLIYPPLQPEWFGPGPDLSDAIAPSESGDRPFMFGSLGSGQVLNLEGKARCLSLSETVDKVLSFQIRPLGN